MTGETTDVTFDILNSGNSMDDLAPEVEKRDDLSDDGLKVSPSTLTVRVPEMQKRRAVIGINAGSRARKTSYDIKVNVFSTIAEKMDRTYEVVSSECVLELVEYEGHPSSSAPSDQDQGREGDGTVTLPSDGPAVPFNSPSGSNTEVSSAERALFKIRITIVVISVLSPAVILILVAVIVIVFGKGKGKLGQRSISLRCPHLLRPWKFKYIRGNDVTLR